MTAKISKKEERRRAEVRANWKAGWELMMAGQTEAGYDRAFKTEPEMLVSDLTWLREESERAATEGMRVVEILDQVMEWATAQDKKRNRTLGEIVEGAARRGDVEAQRALASGDLHRIRV